MFTLVRNLAGFPANPSPYPTTSGETYKKGTLVKIASGAATKATTSDASGLLGVVAENVASGEKSTVLVYDNPLNVYRAGYSGTAPVVFNAVGINSDADTINASASNKPLLAVAVGAGTADVILKSQFLR